MNPAVVVVAGATATGKTALGEALAAALGGEVVCADSRQVFRELDAGTGKPTPDERAERPHHLFDALALEEAASAGWYARAAAPVIAAIRARGRVPVLVGGSGLYLRAAEHGLAPTPASDPAKRRALLDAWDGDGGAALRARLRAGDPETAARLEAADRQRHVRALEVLESTGRPLSWWHRQPRAGAIPGPWRTFELCLEVRALDRRIAARAREMFAGGLVEETEALRAAGRSPALTGLRAVGYDEALALLEGRRTRAEAEAGTILRTRQLAKRQRTWFRRHAAERRLDGTASLAALTRAVRDALAPR